MTSDDHTVTGGDGDVRRPVLEVRGTGGRLVLWDDEVWLIKRGIFSGFANLLGFGLGRIEKSIVIRQISSITIVQPLLFPNFITFTYPGSPARSGNMLRDALAENSLLMNIFDNRRFFELKARMDRLRHESRPGEGAREGLVQAPD